MNWKPINIILLLLITAFLSPLSHAEAAWIDVRSKVEHMVDNIEGDLRIPHDDIVNEVSLIFSDKNMEINLYCLSGGRAEKAMLALKKAGYTNVSNIGGIKDARKKRGLSE